MALSRLSIDLTANIARFESDMNRAARISKRQTDRMRKDMERFAIRAGQVLGTALATGLVAATKAAADFEESMAEIATLLDDTSSLDKTANAIKDISVQFGQAPTAQAKALYQIISAGASESAEQITQLTAANKLAVGGLTSVETAADGLTSVLNAYAGTGLSAERITDVMFETMRRGKTTIGELSASVGNVATIAAQTGVSFEELGASIATVTVGGINTSQAVDGLRGVLAAVLKQSDQTKEAAEELGIAFDVTALKGEDGLLGVLKDIASSGATEDQLSRLVGRVEGLTNLLAQVRNEGKLFIENLEGIEAAAGAGDVALAKMMETAAFKAAKARAAFQVLSINIGQTFLASVSDAAVSFVENFKKIEKGILIVIGAIKILANTVQAVIQVLVGLGDVIVQTFKYVVANVIESLKLVNNVSTRMLKFDFAGAIADVESSMGRFNAIFVEAGEGSAHAMGFVAESLAKIPKAVTDVLDELVEWENANREVEASVSDLDGAISSFVGDVLGLNDGLEEIQTTGKRMSFEFVKLKDAIKSSKPELRAIAELWKEFDRTLEDVIEEQGRYEKSLQSMIDTAFPVQALVREFEQRLRDLNRAFREGKIGPEEYQIVLNHFSNALGEAAAASQQTADQIVTDADRMKEAALEGVRQMTQAFGNMWTNILTGAENSFDGIRDAFASMMSDLLRSATTDKIQLQFEAAFGEGGGGFKDLNFGELGKSFGAIAAAEFADDIVQGLFGDATTKDYVEIGKQIGTVVGAVIGSLIPIIGTAVGAIIGSFSGALHGLKFGKIFGREFKASLGGREAAGDLPGAQVLATALADVVGIHGQGGFGDLNDPETFGGELGEAIKAVDQAIFDILAALDAEEEFAAIVSALEEWQFSLDGGVNNVEALLKDRFGTVLDQMSDDVRLFSLAAENIESQIERFGIALSAEKLFQEEPDLFGGASLAQFLDVVEAFKGEFQTLGEAFQEVAQQLVEINALTDFLGEFAASDLEGEFNALVDAQNRSLGEVLANVNSRLMDAVANFDGSVEGLQEIAGLVATVREGEIRYLTQIDSIQKGIAARLQSLREDILGVTAEPKSITDTLLDAEGLLRAVQNATDASDVADLSQQFDTLLRGLTDDQKALAQTDLLTLIDAFEQVSNLRLEQFRDDALTNAQNMRDAVERVLSELADPLALIASTNERAAQALESLAGTTSTEPFTPDIISETPSEPPGGQDIQDSQVAETNRIMEGGLNEIALALRENNPELAAAIAAAIRQITIQPIITLPEHSLVNQ